MYAKPRCSAFIAIKEGKQAVPTMTRPSWHWFRSKEVRLWLRVTAYDLGN